MNKINSAFKQHALDLYIDTPLRIVDIAKRCGCTSETITVWVNEAIPVSQRRRRGRIKYVLPSRSILRVLTSYKKLKSYTEVAREVGCTRHAAYSAVVYWNKRGWFKIMEEGSPFKVGEHILLDGKIYLILYLYDDSMSAEVKDVETEQVHNKLFFEVNGKCARPLTAEQVKLCLKKLRV